MKSCSNSPKTQSTVSDKEQHYPLSFSSLKAFARSPLAFIHYKEGQRVETPAMRFGTMVHRAVLEPERYQESVAVYDGYRRGKEWKAFEEENQGRDILTVKEALDVKACADRLMSHPFAGGLLSDLSEAEKPFHITQCGVPHRGIIDGITSWAMLDLKVTQRVDHHSLQRTIWDFKYYMQAAIYERAAVLGGYEPEAYFIVAVESAAPHHVNVVELEPHYIARGHLEWEQLLDQYKAWDGEPHNDHDTTPGHGMMDAPAWVPALDWDSDQFKG